MNEELDSQLSAMFDDELPSGECELLARRLSRDELLKARWSRYAVIGAVIRAERGVVLQSAVAGRVNAALTQEPRLEQGARAGFSWMRFAAGAGLAAGVAAMSILWLRTQDRGVPGQGMAAQTLAAQNPAPVPDPALARTSAPANMAASDSFVVPPMSQRPQPMLMPPTQLADYVVAHSAYSWPINRGSLLSSLMVSDPATLGPVAGGRRAAAGHHNATRVTR